MAFGGAPVPATLPVATPPVGQFGPQNTIQLTGLTLAAFVANPAAIANADTGELTTGTPAANQTQLAPTFGRGHGNWTPGDAQLIKVDVVDAGDVTQGAGGQIPLPHVALVAGAQVTVTGGGDIVIRIHNKGLLACPTLIVYLTYQHSLIR